MNYFIQNYFKPAFFNADLFRTLGTVIPPDPQVSVNKGGGSNRKRWVFTLPSGRVVWVSDLRLLDVILKSESDAELLLKLTPYITESKEAALQKTLADAITALLVLYSEQSYASMSDALLAAQESLEEEAVEEATEAARQAYISKRSIEKGIVREVSNLEQVADVLYNDKLEAEAEEERLRVEEEQAHAQLDDLVHAWLDTTYAGYVNNVVEVAKAEDYITTKANKLKLLMKLAKEEEQNV